MTRAAWLNRASELVVKGRCTDLALKALKQLTRLDATIEQMETQVPSEVRDRLETDDQLMTVAELLSLFREERHVWPAEQVLIDILETAASYVKNHATTCALDLARHLLKEQPYADGDSAAEFMAARIANLAAAMLKQDDKRRQANDDLDDDDDDDRWELLSPNARGRLEAIRAAAQEPTTTVPAPVEYEEGRTARRESERLRASGNGGGQAAGTSP
jgi:hypothetical protein